MQSDYMGYLLEPVNYMTSVTAGSLGDISGSMNNFRNMFSYIRDSIAGIVTGIFGVFLNMLIEFQKITMGIKDLMGKTTGILTTLLYVVDGSMMTMQSGWNGPPGQLVRSIGRI
jgi:prophage DNA circulation protein